MGDYKLSLSRSNLTSNLKQFYLEFILDPHLERAKRAEKVLGVTALKMRTNTGDSLPVWSTRVTRSPDSMGSGSSGPVNMKSRGP
jgi:hypothetical protein